MTPEQDDQTTEKTIEQLTSLLETESHALLEGDLTLAVGLVTEKETLVRTLNAAEQVNQTELAKLHKVILRNQALLDGTLKGIRAVAARVAEIRKVKRSLDTYDALGTKQTIQNDVQHRLEKRA